MKKRMLLICFLSVLAAEIIALVFFAVRASGSPQDTVAVNEVVQSVARDFNALEGHKNAAALDYVVLDENGKLLYKTKSGLSESVNAAIAHRDTILDITIDGNAVGKVIIFNDGALSLQSQKRTAVTVLSVAVVINGGICFGYAVYMHCAVVRPFGKLKGFAERVAGGNLDIPLEMDRGNIFGAFTESFDIMRSELQKARVAEAKANASKKELAAKLSHDIKTPVASIKAVSEVGLAVSPDKRNAENYARIISKADQINTLVTNLFTATLEELQQLTVTPVYMQSKQVKTMLENADYLKKAVVPEIPDCLIYADGLRLQQVFDNIFSNSYKYANTAVTVGAALDGGALSVTVEDCGGGAPEEELPALKQKFKRGGNAANTDGAGLGLYIADFFMTEMHGSLTVENGARGLKVTVTLPLSGK